MVTSYWGCAVVLISQLGMSVWICPTWKHGLGRLQNSMLNRFHLNTLPLITFSHFYYFSDSFTFVSWCWSCFVCSGFAYEIYSGCGPSMYVYCVFYHVIAAPYVSVGCVCTLLHSWWLGTPLDWAVFATLWVSPTIVIPICKLHLQKGVIIVFKLLGHTGITLKYVQVSVFFLTDRWLNPR